MPSGPKNQHINRHVQEAKEREQNRKITQKVKQEAESEDAAWRDDGDKYGDRKASRQAEKDAKREEQLQKKREKEKLLEEEEKELRTGAPPKNVSKRQQQKAMAALVRNYDLEQRMKEDYSEEKSLVQRRSEALMELPKHGNPNRLEVEDRSAQATTTENASGVEGGLKLMEKLSGSGGDKVTGNTGVTDRNVGKRARVAYKKFKQINLPLLRESKPKMRLSQYEDLLWSMWQKCPDNPFVQRAESKAEDALMTERHWWEEDVSSEGETEEK